MSQPGLGNRVYWHLDCHSVGGVHSTERGEVHTVDGGGCTRGSGLGTGLP